jgi:shikimate dehydrogenase
LAESDYNQRVPARFSKPITATTRYCAVYGHPIKHSASPAMQNAGLAALGLNWRYLAFEVHPDNLRVALEGASFMRFVGINLTVPHKLLALGMMDVLDESARKWGAVNTVRFEGKDARGPWRPLREFEDTPRQVRSVGFNTDADAISRALHQDMGLKLAGSRVLLLGAGGAGRTAALKLASDNVKELFLVNRTRSKAEAVAREIRRRYPRVRATVGYAKGSVDLLINATSLGLKPADPLPFDEKKFSIFHAEAVYDMIYRPAKTRLLKLAAAKGCRTSNGLGMLLYQGAKALEIWTDRSAPIGIMRRALEKELKKSE